MSRAVELTNKNSYISLQQAIPSMTDRTSDQVKFQQHKFVALTSRATCVSQFSMVATRRGCSCKTLL